VWSQALQSGVAADRLQSLHDNCSKELGQLEAVQILESAARRVGRIFPLSCLKVFLATFPVDLLSAEKANASARDRIWDEFLAARQDLDRAQVRLAEAEMNKWASVGRLAAGMAHEINNPLAYMIGNVSLVKEELEGEASPPSGRPEQLEMMNDAMAGLEQIRNIVRDLQIFSRTRRAKKQAVDLEATLSSIIKIVGTQVGRGITVKEEFSGVPQVLANEGKVGQILLNLLVNACQSSIEAEKTQIIVRTLLDGEAVRIEIEDCGAGVQSELREQIFEPFFTTKDVDQGTGLGLAISREIAEQHEGTLELDTSYTGGARFRLTLPINAGDATEAEADKIPQPSRSLRILFVDDDQAIRNLASQSLGKVHDLTIAADGVEAQEHLQASQEFDVIVLDLQLPKRSGGEVFAWLEHHHPSLTSKVLIMSGGPTTAQAADFLADHASQTLNKPASLEEIEQAILGIANASSAS
jgi:signal transduction histidine kinase/CheY-like chemotaxis protein